MQPVRGVTSFPLTSTEPQAQSGTDPFWLVTP